MQIVHMADIHLGARPYHYDELKQDIIEAFRISIEYVLRVKPDALIIAGDLFDRPRIDHSIIIDAMTQIRMIADRGIKVILAHGEHDTPGRRDKTILELLAMAIDNVYAPRPSGSVEEVVRNSTIRLERGVVSVYKFYKVHIERQRSFARTLLPAYKKYLHGMSKPRVFVAHIGVEGPLPPDATIVNVNDLPDIEYAALGHHHGRWIRRNDSGGPILTVYPGSLYPLNIREARSKHVRGPILIDLSGDEPVIQEEFNIEISKHYVLGEMEVNDLVVAKKRINTLIAKYSNNTIKTIIHLPLAIHPSLQRTRVEETVSNIAKKHGVLIIPHIRRIQQVATEKERIVLEPILDPIEIIRKTYNVSKHTAELIIELKDALVTGDSERATKIIEELTDRGELLKIARNKRWLK